MEEKELSQSIKSKEEPAQPVLADKTNSNETPLRFFNTWGKIFLVLFLALSLFFFVSLVIVITLTKSEVQISIPKLRHQYFVDAFHSIQSKGLKIDLELRDYPGLNKGYIVDQIPAPGVLARPGSKIKLIVVRGSLFCQVPSLAGIAEKSANGVLDSVQVQGRKAELTIGEKTYIASNEEQAGVIIDQIPKAGERVPLGAKVHLLISSGPVKPGFRMADYTNQDIDLLYQVFEMREIAVDYSVSNVQDKTLHGRILKFSPKKGQLVNKGDQVSLTVGIFKENLFHRVGYEVIKHRIPKELDGKIVELYIQDNQPRRRRFRKLVKAGEQIQVIVRRVGDARITFESDNKPFHEIKIKENANR